MGKIIYITMVITIVYLLVYWSNSIYNYICAHCGFRFSISLFTNLISPNFFRTKYLRCPECKDLSWCQAVRKEKNNNPR